MQWYLGFWRFRPRFSRFPQKTAIPLRTPPRPVPEVARPSVAEPSRLWFASLCIAESEVSPVPIGIFSRFWALRRRRGPGGALACRRVRRNGKYARDHRAAAAPLGGVPDLDGGAGFLEAPMTRRCSAAIGKNAVAAGFTFGLDAVDLLPANGDARAERRAIK